MAKNQINNPRVLNGHVVSLPITADGTYVLAPKGKHILIKKINFGDPEEGVNGTLTLNNGDGVMVDKWMLAAPGGDEMNVSKRQLVWGDPEYEYIDGATFVVANSSGTFCITIRYDIA